MIIQKNVESGVTLAPSASTLRSRRFSFSLWSLFVALLLGALVASHLITSRKLFQVEEENSALRIEAGLLTLEDPTKIHALGIPQADEFHWKWRIYLPRGRKYSLHHRTHEIPLVEVPSQSDGTSLPADGEELLEAVLRRDGEKHWHFDIIAKSITSSSSIPDEDLAWQDLPTRMTSTHKIDSGDQFTASPDGPVTLLRLRVIYLLEPPDQETDGLMIWITSEPDNSAPRAP